MAQSLIVDILRNGELLYRDFNLDYGRVSGDSVEIVQLLREALSDHTITVQLYVSQERPCREVNWRAQALLLDHRMLKTTLDRLRGSHLTINTTYRKGTAADRPLVECVY